MVDDNIQNEFERMKKEASGEVKPGATIDLNSKKGKKFFVVDWSDMWNWVLLVIAAGLLFWGARSIYLTLTNWGV